MAETKRSNKSRTNNRPKFLPISAQTLPPIVVIRIVQGFLQFTTHLRLRLLPLNFELALQETIPVGIFWRFYCFGLCFVFQFGKDHILVALCVFPPFLPRITLIVLTRNVISYLISQLKLIPGLLGILLALLPRRQLSEENLKRPGPLQQRFRRLLLWSPINLFAFLLTLPTIFPHHLLRLFIRKGGFFHTGIVICTNYNYINRSEVPPELEEIHRYLLFSIQILIVRVWVALNLLYEIIVSREISRKLGLI